MGWAIVWCIALVALAGGLAFAKYETLRIERIERERSKKEAWDASYRCYDLCEPPAYIRKAEGYRWLGRVEG